MEQTFKTENKWGKQGEQIIMQHCRKNHNAKVYDLSADKNYQAIDIDAIIAAPNAEFSAEIKTDSYRPQNLCLEYISNDKKGTKGWFIITQADYIAYYFVNYDVCFWMPTAELREYIIPRMDSYKHTIRPTISDSGNFLYNSHNILVPIREIEKALGGIYAETVCAKDYPAQYAELKKFKKFLV
jgi:hypothetical protein